MDTAFQVPHGPQDKGPALSEKLYDEEKRLCPLEGRHSHHTEQQPPCAMRTDVSRCEDRCEQMWDRAAPMAPICAEEETNKLKEGDEITVTEIHASVFLFHLP